MAKYLRLTGKILSLLANGLLLGYSRDRRNRNELLKECDRIWLSIDRNQLFSLLRILHFRKFVELQRRRDGVNFVRITKRGERVASRFRLDELKIRKPRRWDRKWRVVIFDIPEGKKKLRDALRRRLKFLGFHEFQKSVFVSPYPSEDEVNILVNFFGLKEHVRYLESVLSYDADLREIFNV